MALYYHHVPAGSRARFARQMDLLKRIAIPRPPIFTGPMEAGMRYAIVTFDDGFESVVDNALPELEKRDIPSAFLVPTGCLGRFPGWEIEPGYRNDVGRVVDEERLKSLSGRSVVVGSHTVSHARLSSGSEDGARKELVDSKKRLESILGGDVTLLSIPYGDTTPSMLDLAREAGYTRIFTSDPSVARGDSVGSAVGRFSVSPDESLAEFGLKLLGAYAWEHEARKFGARLRHGR